MPTPSSPSFLHRVLIADAALCLTAGLVLLAAGGLAAGLLGLPAGLLRAAGLALLPVAVFISWLARQPAPRERAVVLLVVLNVAWVLASILLLLCGLVAPTMLGTAFVLAQAALVAAFAGLETAALRRTRSASPRSAPAGRGRTAPG